MHSSESLLYWVNTLNKAPESTQYLADSFRCKLFFLSVSFLMKLLKNRIIKGEGTWLVVVISLCQNPLSLQLFMKVGHEVPGNLQQDKYYSLFCNFLSQMNENCYTFKCQSLGNGPSSTYNIKESWILNWVQ